MKRLTFDIHATDTECSDGNKRCQFMGGTRFGTRFVCMLFGNHELSDADGVPSGPARLQRLKACKDATEEPSESIMCGPGKCSRLEYARKNHP